MGAVKLVTRSGAFRVVAPSSVSLGPQPAKQKLVQTGAIHSVQGRVHCMTLGLAANLNKSLS